MIKDIKQFMSAINQLCAEKNLDREIVMEAIRAAIRTAYKKDFGTKEQNIQVDINEVTGGIEIYLLKTIVKEVEDPDMEISLKEAKQLRKDAKEGQVLAMDVTPAADYGRIAAQAAKQVIIQRIQEAEREKLFETFKERENELITAMVTKVEGGQVYLEIERNLVVLPSEEAVHGERYLPGLRLRVYLNKVIRTPQGPHLLISRRSPELVKKLFEFEIPEVRNGIVTVKAISRSPGVRSKVAVTSSDEKVDPIGACVGQKGVRIQAIIKEMNGEMIDVIEWSPDPAQLIRSALSPAKVSEISFYENQHRAIVYVTTDQRPLAIGRQGQNVELASKLTGYELDIRDLDQYVPGATGEELFAKEQQAGEAASEEEVLPETSDTVMTIAPEELYGDDGVELLELPEGTADKLKGAGVEKILHLSRMSSDDLTQIGGIGKTAAEAILQAVRAYKK